LAKTGPFAPSSRTTGVHFKPADCAISLTGCAFGLSSCPLCSEVSFPGAGEISPFAFAITTFSLERIFEKYRKGRVHGYQVEIATNGTAGNVYDEGRRGKWLNELNQNETFKDGEWNHYRVLCVGNLIKTWVNGVLIADFRDDMTKTGFIGLQVHGFKGDSPAWVRWRNIRLHDLTRD